MNLILTIPSTPKADSDSDEHLIHVHMVVSCADEIFYPLKYPVPEYVLKELIPCFDIGGTVVTAPSELAMNCMAAQIVTGQETLEITLLERQRDLRIDQRD